VVAQTLQELVEIRSAGETACPTRAASCWVGLVAQALSPAIMSSAQIVRVAFEDNFIMIYRQRFNRLWVKGSAGQSGTLPFIVK
jgi:hypothetical protein